MSIFVVKCGIRVAIFLVKVSCQKKLQLILAVFYYYDVMTFNNDYKRLISYSETIVRNRKLNIDATELVHDAYLMMSNTPYSFEAAKSAISNASFISLDEKISNFRTTEETSNHCTVCNEIKPISGFYFIRKGNNLSPRNVCKDCYIKKQLSNYSKNKPEKLIKNTLYKQANKERIRLKKKQYYLRNKKQLNAA